MQVSTILSYQLTQIAKPKKLLWYLANPMNKKGQQVAHIAVKSTHTKHRYLRRADHELQLHWAHQPLHFPL
ncbi:hypothetical protein CCM_08445 [Cordyceps militaris CM01]|uniref:Uncharacterized protein n=1 Tax=Cordyceps militaris (strain CM01) TaxID=983644 RepID=G3JRA5_CORMM|nr:uncharacterized protein CCM_08445 [Cordyceps militaris CM01]EGX88401.1 hypothetical protein CCM_08445 [Cordyceps militaris CM01]